MKRISISLVTSILLAPALGWTDEVPPPHDPHAAHAATDQDHDGEIDPDEFRQRIIQVFYFADVDRDGFVTIGQLRVFDEDRLFEIADLDGDSRLSLAEFLNARAENFRGADTNRNGTLSVEEVVEEFNR